jgi:hypothetical protein
MGEAAPAYISTFHSIDIRAKQIECLISGGAPEQLAEHPLNLAVPSCVSGVTQS